MRNSLYRLLPAVLLGVACLYTYRIEVRETHTHDAAGITALSATTQNGTISVAASPDTVITVNVLKRAYGRDSADASAAIANVGYSDTVIGHELRVKAEMQSSNRPYGADLTVTAPDSRPLALEHERQHQRDEHGRSHQRRHDQRQCRADRDYRDRQRVDD